MTTSRRDFLGSILALSAAPAIVRAQSPLPVAPPIRTPDEAFTLEYLSAAISCVPSKLPGGSGLYMGRGKLFVGDTFIGNVSNFRIS